MFATGSSKPHSLRKRMISNVYSKSYIQSSQASKSQIAEVLFNRFLPALYGSPDRLKGQPSPDHAEVEVFSLFLATAMDLITAYIFGLSNATNFIADESYRRVWQDMYLARANYPFWTQEVSGLTAFCKKWAPWFQLYPEWVDISNKELANWNWGLCERVRKSTQEIKNLSSYQEVKDVEEPVVYNALCSGIDREFKGSGENSLLYSTSILQHDRAIASELMDHSLAGQETAGIVLTYATWHISKSPSLQRQLHDEIKSLKPSLKFDPKATSGTPAFPDPKKVDSLQLLHAVVIETLRLHAPIPGPQPRQTPRDGCTIGGHYIPSGVRIASLAYTLHRDKDIFPQPEEWKPERWLRQKDEYSDGNELRYRDMQRQFWAFGSGGRMCIGSNFAMNEMKFIIAVIYVNFQTTIVDDDGINQEDAYTARPVGERLVIRFTHLKD
ncbi:putative benzoate 4-monooxygenase cytochrome P450 [Fusarium austroafricanum]|uniref:Putative benzoate 4-monooxygenase cytochrome P450 n=1 Tax=Fusarium austroafricanum TaxID=2364996 RepID=A0A8H4KBX1_9HYPO|nr:putative benzoate 4-monooxygenase cytochrome P450 [Fusarium austroafricanum]